MEAAEISGVAFAALVLWLLLNLTIALIGAALLAGIIIGKNLWRRRKRG